MSILSNSAPSKSKLLLILLGLVALAGCGREGPLPPASDDSLRTIQQGEVIGYVGQYGSHVWRGIPYAAPPVGDLRWRAPQSAASWSTTRKALRQGSFCPQFASRYGGVDGDEGEVRGSEDCLYLDVYAPRREPAAVPTDNERVPVLVWIHGGGNVIGHKGFYDGGNLAQTHDVVVVAINYRLGPLGWFRHASLRDGGGSADDRSGNFGTLDMVHALEWVRDNISAFGGDPDRVTIFGESAGGTDVFSLLVSPRAEGLFHRAIAQSGGTHFHDAEMAESLREEGGSEGSSNEALVALLRSEEGTEDRKSAKARLMAMSSTEIADYLRSQSPEALLGVYATEESEGLVEVPLIFREGHVIPVESAMERFSDPETWNVVPVIAGTNRDENKLFMFGDPKWVKQRFGFIPRLRDEDAFNVEARYRSLMWKASGSDEPATSMRTNSEAVWSYRFDWDEEPKVLGAELSMMLGAAHGFEIPFVFGHFDLGEAGNVIFTDDNLHGREELSSAMMSYWAQFAATGNPGQGRDGSLPLWSNWSRGDEGTKFMILETTAGGGMRMSRDTVTQAEIVAAAEKDPFLEIRDDRCEILGRIVSWSDVAVPPECESIEPMVAGGSGPRTSLD
jgi:para-nitrobenzyl esterase